MISVVFDHNRVLNLERESEGERARLSKDIATTSVLQVLHPGLFVCGDPQSHSSRDIPLLHSPNLGYPWAVNAIPITWDGMYIRTCSLSHTLPSYMGVFFLDALPRLASQGLKISIFFFLPSSYIISSVVAACLVGPSFSDSVLRHAAVFFKSSQPPTQETHWLTRKTQHAV